MNPAVILSAVRTPVGRYMGGLKTVEAYDLAALVLSAAIEAADMAAIFYAFGLRVEVDRVRIEVTFPARSSGVLFRQSQLSTAEGLCFPD